MKKQLSFFLALALLLTSCGGGSGTAAATMHLRRAEGTVGVADGEGKAIELRENLGLYSGYGVGTQAESYAWIDLDKVKLTKLDQDSEIAITKDGKKLEIEVKSGSLFFNVTEPLADDETMNIRTSTMMVGIRGTCGWVEVPDSDTMKIFLLEGRVRCEVDGERETVRAGEMAVMTDDGEITVTEFTAADIPEFVMAELEDDDDLVEVILDDSGIDVLNPVDPMRLRDMYTYSKAFGYINGELIQEFEYFSDEQGRIQKYVSRSLNTGDESVCECIYNDAGTLSKQIFTDSDGSTSVTTVTEDTLEHRITTDEDGKVSIRYYDEQGLETRVESIYNGTTSVTYQSYDAEGRRIRSTYSADTYMLYEYD